MALGPGDVLGIGSKAQLAPDDLDRMHLPQENGLLRVPCSDSLGGHLWPSLGGTPWSTL